MGCGNCNTGQNGSPAGCQNNGFCSSGGCNKLNTFDWFSQFGIPSDNGKHLVEVSFKNGARKDFYNNPLGNRVITGDMVVVGSDSGYDVGRVSLSGELVHIQLKKKKIRKDRVFHDVLRPANDRDLEKLIEGRSLEKKALVKARVISRTLGLDMKIGDVEYQGDKRKATFYYTADGRVDFRELVRQYAREFRVKIEMRQIGARQESSRIGGLGSCGRELCCSSWLTDFKSVTTAAARYQNLAINQSKLSGQCGRLKCCLNYELDSYVDALDKFPEKATELQTQAGKAYLIKMDIFKGLMFYSMTAKNGKMTVFPLTVEDVKSIQIMNKKGEKPVDLKSVQTYEAYRDIDDDIDIKNVGDVIELPEEKRRRPKRRNKRRKGNRNNQRNNQRKK